MIWLSIEDLNLSARVAHFLFSAFWGSLAYYVTGRTFSDYRTSMLFLPTRWALSLSVAYWAHLWLDLTLKVP